MPPNCLFLKELEKVISLKEIRGQQSIQNYPACKDVCLRQSLCCISQSQGFFQQFWEKDPGQNLEKKIALTAKLGDINDIVHNKGGEIYSQNQGKANHFT